MRKNIFVLSLLAVVAVAFTACSEDELSGESVIKNPATAQTPFDNW